MTGHQAISNSARFLSISDYDNLTARTVDNRQDSSQRYCEDTLKFDPQVRWRDNISLATPPSPTPGHSCPTHENCRQKLQALEARVSQLEHQLQSQTTTVSPLLKLNDGYLNNTIVSGPHVGTPPAGASMLSSEYRYFDTVSGFDLVSQPLHGFGSGSNALGINGPGQFINLQPTNNYVTLSAQDPCEEFLDLSNADDPSDNTFLAQLSMDNSSKLNYHLNSRTPDNPSSPLPLVGEVAQPPSASVSLASATTTRFRCTFPNCVMSFGRKGDRTRHERIHDPNGRRFSCTIAGCDRHFYRADKLSEHLQMHRQQ
ncbi:hypothetical protein G7Y89_g4943 [Cudoniella acicularis]|uniref:C2H2-type domain-containing protein n=1 Tax=Cudoniella acicularis TaxID=354080 RepID=A0A8H4W3U3_9HELO|nr:hypothetical protein G7Y89_g4943 [Cudoniella acicularis]